MLIAVLASVAVLAVSTVVALLLGRFIAFGDRPDREDDAAPPQVEAVIHHAIAGPWFDDQPSWSCSCGAVRFGTSDDMRAHRSTFGPHDIEGRSWGTPVGKPEGTER